MRYVFENFELDTERYELRQAGTPQALEPQGFNVLVYLVEHHDRVVSKEELLEQLWPDQYVTEATLTQRLVAVRRALGDSGRRQHYIKTVHGHGYRFVAPLTSVDHPIAEPAPLPSPIQNMPVMPTAPPDLIERDAELQHLHECFRRMLAGTRQCVMVTGEAGIGKTTLLQAFVSAVESHAGLLIGYGQCIEHYGAGEAYLPLLEALGRLCRQPAGGSLVTILRQYAPTWLLQMSGYLSAEEQERLQHLAMGTTQGRMMRELTEALEVLTAQQPLLLIVEDLHWSDASTLEWLAYAGRRRDPARLLILGTARLVEAQALAHPLVAIMHEMQRQGQATALKLSTLPATGTALYVTQRFGEQDWSEALATMLHRHSNGNPFFMMALIEALIHQGVLIAEDPGWTLRADLQALAVTLPDSIRQLITHHLSYLSPEEQELLQIASVAGVEFATVVIAAITSQSVEDIEAAYARLARRGQFVRESDVETWPDGTMTVNYRFLHPLYHEALYDRVAAGSRARWHRQIGECKAVAYGQHSAAIAAELAMHFDRGQDSLQAVHYYRQASATSLLRRAHREAVGHVRRALTLLESQPETPEREALELALLVMLGGSLQTTQSDSTLETSEVYPHAFTLSQLVVATPQLLSMLLGLGAFSASRAQYQKVQELGEQCLQLAQSLENNAYLSQAHILLGQGLLGRGKFSMALEHLERGAELYEPRGDEQQHSSQHPNPGVLGLVLTGRILWYLGYAARAEQRLQQAYALAHELSHPGSLIWMLGSSAWFKYLCGEVASTQEQSQATIRLATEHDVPHWTAQGMMLYGWALTMQGQGARGLEQMRQGLAMYQDTKAEAEGAPMMALLAQALYQSGEVEEALTWLDTSLRSTASLGTDDYRAELLRLKGEGLLAHSATQETAAEQYFLESLALARQQRAKGWELRTAISLGQLWRHQRKITQTQQLVAEVYQWFTEGFDTADLRQARALLDDVRP